MATSKSSVSRHFVAATRKGLAELLARPLGDQRYLVLMLHGVEVADHTVVVALGITAGDQKRILRLWEGATPLPVRLHAFSKMKKTRLTQSGQNRIKSSEPQHKGLTTFGVRPEAPFP